MNGAAIVRELQHFPEGGAMRGESSIERFRGFRANLAALRKASGATRREIADRTGISYERLRKIETRPGRIPRPEEVAELARFFRTTPERLLGLDEANLAAWRQAAESRLQPRRTEKDGGVYVSFRLREEDYLLLRGVAALDGVTLSGAFRAALVAAHPLVEWGFSGLRKVGRSRFRRQR